MTSEQPGQVEGATGMNEQKPVDIEAIRVRANAATEGPWVKSVCQIMPFSGSQQDSWHKYRDDSWDVFRGCFVGGLLQLMAIRVCRIMAGSEDAAFIAHSRQDIPALCDEVEALRVRVKELESRGEYEGELFVTDFTCQTHGLITPYPCCPECETKGSEQV